MLLGHGNVEAASELARESLVAHTEFASAGSLSSHGRVEAASEVEGISLVRLWRGLRRLC